jgi:heat shock protein HslJ
VILGAAEPVASDGRLAAMRVTFVRRVLALVCLVAFAVAACGPTASPSLIRSAVPASLAGTTWRAVLVGREPTVPRSEPTARFTGDQVQGTTGCNDYGSTYRYDNGVIEVDEPISTAIGCDGVVAATEQRFVAALKGASSVAIDADGRLLLDGTGGSITFVVAPRQAGG